MKSIIATAFAAIVSATAFCGNVQLAKNNKITKCGNALADIVVSAEAGRSTRFAAADLAWHLKKITGADFAVVTDADISATNSQHSLTHIFVGPSTMTKAKKEDFKFQQYRVDIAADRIELVGWDDDPKVGAKEPVPFVRDGADGRLQTSRLPGMFDKHGSLYAVYQFLEEQCGVKWVDCTDYGTLIPKNENLTVEEGVHNYEPFIEYRGGTIEYSMKSDYWRSGTEEQKEYEAMAYVNPKQDARRNAFLYMLRHRAGGRYAQCNHSLYYFYSFYFNKESKSFKEYHPEYFSKGGPADSEPTQLCYSNPDVVDRVAADIASYFDSTNANFKTPMYNSRNAGGTIMKYWGEDNCALEPMDNGGFCQCPDCKKLLDMDKAKYGRGDSTLWFTFVKKVADKLLVTNPGCTITTLAYGGHEFLPIDVTLPKNVNVVFCTSSNRGGPRGEGMTNQMARLEKWREAYPDSPMGVWFYSGFPYEFYNNGRYQGVHGYYAHEAGKQYRDLKRLNLRQGVFQCGLEGAICQYVNFALLLDPEADIDKLLSEYFSQFGAAAPFLREFYDIVEERYCDPSTRNPSSAGPEQNWKYVLPPEHMDKLEALIEKARTRPLSPVEQKRVELFIHANWNYMKLGQKMYLKRATAPQPTWEVKRTAELGGDIDKVDWKALPEQDLEMFERGSEESAKLDWKTTYRVAHDGKFLYLEFNQIRPSEHTIDQSKPGLVISPGIACFDTWEFVIARKRAMPYRYFLCGGADKMTSWSNGEINFRKNVLSTEHKEYKNANFNVTFRSIESDPTRWTCRWVFPLDSMSDTPVKPGEEFVFNPVTVLHPGACGQHPYGIFGPVTLSTVHTYDRGITVKLAE